MTRITHDGQSFSIDNRRVWLVGAGIDYARVPPDMWADRIAAAKQAGFNTVVTTCPWLVHEPRKGRYVFDGFGNVRRFVELCIEQELYVGVKVGPYVGGSYDGGGLPSWLREIASISLRDGGPLFMERVSLYLRKLIGEFSNLQVTSAKPGGVIFVQAEQSWHCTNDDLAESYLAEINRHIRENGVYVPIFTANGLWIDTPGTVETWTGWDGLLSNLRQLRVIHPDRPRVVSSLEIASPVVWGEEPPPQRDADAIVHRVAQVLAAGAQPMLAGFHGGTNFGFLGGRMPGGPDRFVATAAAPGTLLGEGGARSAKYERVKRIMTFASHFGFVFAELDTDYQPVTLAVDQIGGEDAASRRKRCGGPAVVPLRGAQGRVVFLFGEPGVTDQAATLLLDNGLPLTIHMGDQWVTWLLLDVDLGGRGRLDYCNLRPFALIDRSILVLYGPEKSPAHLSINESAMETTVPTGAKPRVIRHGDMTVVICNEQQIDATYIAGSRVYVGADGLDASGQPLPKPGFTHITVIGGQGEETQTQRAAPIVKAPPTIRLDTWGYVSCSGYVDGSNPRFASIAGPETLDACGTPSGYGWYRVQFKSASAAKRLCAVPDIGQRLHLYVDGDPMGIAGTGPGTMGNFFELRVGKGEHVAVGLADHTGRFSGGNDFGRRKGWFGHLFAVKPVKASRPKIESGEPISPLSVRPFILGQSETRLTSDQQIVWSFEHRRKTPIIIHVHNVEAYGAFLLNGTPVTWYAGATGETAMRFVVQADDSSPFKRGRNELRFAPDPDCVNGLDAMMKSLALYECVENLTEGGSWGFARWEAPPVGQFASPGRGGPKVSKGQPGWWRTTFTPKPSTVPAWFDTEGLSKGQVYLNGHNVGRYFTATATGARVGPQRCLYLPESWLKPGEENEIMVFDEHGFDPSKTRIEYRVRGEFEV